MTEKKGHRGVRVKVGDVVKALESLWPETRLVGDENTVISGITHDSRDMKEGFLFACVPGLKVDGHQFASAAVRDGAVALLVTDPFPPETMNVPQIIVPSTRSAMGVAASAIYDHPSHKLVVVGITGTNGKTTTSYLVKDVLETLGRPCGLIGTIERMTGSRSIPSSRTTPESTDVQRLMCEMVQNGVGACAMEVSSHALTLERTLGTAFDVVVFTNLSRDHFDFHGDFRGYLEAKLSLFRSDAEKKSHAVINVDDPYGADFMKAAGQSQIVTYGIHGVSHDMSPDVTAHEVRVNPDGVRYVVKTPTGEADVHLCLQGRFNVYNSLAAIATGHALGIHPETAALAIRQTTVPGRFETIQAGDGVTAVVDYAHTPDSLENLLKAARELTTGRVIAVFGAGGDRDAGKRPLMGEKAGLYADLSLITSDNPRSEDPEVIADQVAEGCREVGGNYEILIDREEAIKAAMDSAQSGDVVVIAGKGHETTQEIGDVTHHFDDREIVRQMIKGRS